MHRAPVASGAAAGGLGWKGAHGAAGEGNWEQPSADLRTEGDGAPSLNPTHSSAATTTTTTTTTPHPAFCTSARSALAEEARPEGLRPPGAHAGARSRASAPGRERGSTGAGELGEVSCKSRAEAQRDRGVGRGRCLARGAARRLARAPRPARSGARVGRRARRGPGESRAAWPQGQRDAPTRRAGRISFEARRSIPGFLNPQPTSCPDHSRRGRPTRQVLGCCRKPPDPAP